MKFRFTLKDSMVEEVDAVSRKAAVSRFVGEVQAEGQTKSRNHRDRRTSKGRLEERVETPVTRVRHRPTPARLLCDWHRKGRPPTASSRFYLSGCPACEEKLAKGLCSVDDPTPRQAWLVHVRKLRIRRFQIGMAVLKAKS